MVSESRKTQIIDLRSKGMHWAEIARELHLSRQRIDQIKDIMIKDGIDLDKYNKVVYNHSMENKFETGTGCVCLRCGHKWFVRIPMRPRVCPNCGSPYWDTPRRNGMSANVSEIPPKVYETSTKVSENKGIHFNPAPKPKK